MSDWGTVTLGYLSTQRKGINYKSADYADEYSGHPFITIKCFVKGGGYEPTGIKFYNGFSTKMDHLSTGDILFSVTDLTRAGDIVGSPLRVPEFGGAKPTLASMDCMRIDPVASRCDKGFLYHRLMLSDVRRQMVAYSAGSTVLHLDTKKVPSISVHVPVDVPTQRCIAAILDTIDQAIEKTEVLIEKYQQIKAGLMHDLFTRGIGDDGKLRPPREQAPELYQETPIGWIPKEWDVVSLNNEISISHGYAFSGNGFFDEPPGDVLLTPGNFHRDGGLYFTSGNTKYFRGGIPAETILSPGELVTVMTDLSPQTLILGRFSIIDTDFHVLHNQRIGLVKCKKVERWDMLYLVAALNNERIRKEIIVGATGTTVRHTSPGRILGLSIACPGMEEQENCAAKLNGIQRKLGQEAYLLNKLEQQKSGLMHDLLTGKVSVKVDQPEAVNV